MKLFLPASLQAQRRGRFLTSLLNLASLTDDKLPAAGMVLVTGEQLQSNAGFAAECCAWARAAGRSLLLIPPFSVGRILPEVDWSIEFDSATNAAPISPSNSAQTASLANILASEINYSLLGTDGSCLDSATALPACHTRYWKFHANSGLIAATTLPLWSISLLDQATLVMAYLREIEKHTGKLAPTVEIDSEQKQSPPEILQAQDITVLVFCYGFAVSSAQELAARLQLDAMPLLNLENLDLPASMARLHACGMLLEHGLSADGLTFLQTSKYWPFAAHLKKEA